MPVFSESPQTLFGDFTAIKAKKDADYQNNQSIWNVFWNRANQNVRLESGDPTIMNVWGNNPATLGSSNYYFNRARPIGLMLSGYQRRNRKSSIAVPMENADQTTADQITKLLMNLYKKENVYELISEAFHEGSIISGMNLLQVYLDFTDDPLNGDIKFKNLAYNEFMIDPYFKNPDLSDASFILIRSYMNKPQIASIMPPEYYDEIMALRDNQQGSTIDGRFQYQAAARGYSMGPKLAYDEYWYRDYRKQKKLYDTITGECMDISERTDVDVDKLLLENPQLRIQDKMVPTVRLCITIQDKVFYDGPNPYGIDIYPFVGVLGYYNKAMPYMYNRIQSVMTSLISPQILFNRRIILNADFLESVVNSGYMFKQGAVIDAKHLLQTGQGRLIPLKDSATPLQDVVPIPPPQIPPSAFQQLEVYDKELFNVIGLSQENLGKVVEDDSSGYQSALRTAAGLTAQQPLFDRLDLAQNLLASLTFTMIQNNQTPGKIQRMLGGEQPTPLFYDKAFGKYHFTCELGFNTETQKQLEFAQKLELRKAGINISDAQMIASATLQHKEDLMKELEAASQQQSQMQQMQMQVQMQELQARSQYSQAKSASELALAGERDMRVRVEAAEIVRKSYEDNKLQEEALLNKVKILKELESIDLTHLKELITMSQMLKQQDQGTAPTSPTKAAAQPKKNPQRAGNGSQASSEV